MQQEGLMVQPESILADRNSRYGLKPYRVEALAQNILEQGKILQNLIVEPLVPPANGHKYRLIAGNYRLAAALKLNKEQKAGLLVPIVVEDAKSPLDRLKTQLSENMERENQSPLDRAIAIKQLMDEGVPRTEIRKIFSVPGGRKGGTKLTPASNSFLNIHLQFLDFPKAIRDKIHDGYIGVGGALELAKSPKDKWDSIMARIEAARDKESAQEEKDENALLEAEKKEAERKLAAETLEKELKEAQAKAQEAIAKAVEADKVEKEYYDANKKAKGEEKKLAEASFKAALVETKAAEKLEAAARAELEKIQAKAQKLKEAESKRLEKEANRKKEQEARAKVGAPEASKPVGVTEVKKAAQSVGAGGVVLLNAMEMRKSIAFMASADHLYPKVSAIGKAIQKCFNSELTEGQMISEIAKLVGDKKAPAKK